MSANIPIAVFEEETRIKIVKDLVDELPPIHRDCLQFVIFHLARLVFPLPPFIFRFP